MKDNIEEINISDYSELAYLEYAMSVVKGRAIPAVEDGLKPVHRRILYAMYEAGMIHSSVPKKSARVVGNVLGLYHPHGDQAVYGAMVRQAQDFSVRYCLVDGQGNFGSRDGDDAASMRYTEAKLSSITQLYLDEIKDNCVDFTDNYDGTEREPVFLPARVPFILLNGNPGIAVGMATRIPPHNISEVIGACIEVLEKDNVDIDGIMNFIQGPDFPTRAQMISTKEEIKKIYKEGNGSVRLRSKYKIETNGKNWKLVFYEIPYEVSAKKIMEEVDEIFNPEDKVKKDIKGKPRKISPDKLRLKNLYTNVIAKYTDASDKDNPIRIVFEPKSSKQDPEDLVQILLSTTSLECNVSINLTCIGRDGRPSQKSLDSILYEWVDFRIETVEKRISYHLAKIEERLHILEGRNIILSNIDKVIEIIKNSDDPKTDLIGVFSLSEIQAQDVLDLRLRQIGRLEFGSIEKEIKDLTKKKEGLSKIISSEDNIKKQIIKELKEDLKKYGDERFTEIKPMERVDVGATQTLSNKVNKEEVTVAISEKDWIKVLRGIKEVADFTFKDGDKVKQVIHCYNTDILCLLDGNGRVYNQPALELTREGNPLSSMVQVGDRVEKVFVLNSEAKYLIMQNKAYGFIVTGQNLTTKLKTGKDMVTMVDGATLLDPIELSEDVISNSNVAIITSDNRLVMYPLNTISEIGKGKGVITCGLNKDMVISELKITNPNDSFVIKNNKGKVILTINDENLSGFVKTRTVKGYLLSKEVGNLSFGL